MGMRDVFHNPVPVASVDDILRPDAGNPLIERGWATTSVDALMNWARNGSPGMRTVSAKSPGWALMWGVGMVGFCVWSIRHRAVIGS